MMMIKEIDLNLFHMLWSICRWGGVLGIFSDILKNADNDLICPRSAGGSEAARYTSSQDTLFFYINGQ